MTTEPTLREKVLEAIKFLPANIDEDICEVISDAALDRIIDRVADLLSATGAPAYCRVADDLRGVVREGLDSITPKFDSSWVVSPAPLPTSAARYLGQFDKRGGE